MTMPEQPSDGITAAVFIKLTEIATDVAVIKSQLEKLPDHEQRIRELENTQAQQSGGRDTWARVPAWAAIVAALASGLAQYLHH